jgi:hypothetical protein
MKFNKHRMGYTSLLVIWIMYVSYKVLRDKDDRPLFLDYFTDDLVSKES